VQSGLDPFKDCVDVPSQFVADGTRFIREAMDDFNHRFAAIPSEKGNTAALRA
jgi:hypothetical protein